MVVDTFEDMVEAVGRLERLDRRACREDAEQRFSAPAMAEAYEQVYERLIAGRPRRTIHDMVPVPRTPPDSATRAIPTLQLDVPGAENIHI